MQNYRLPYGTSELTFSLPNERSADLILPYRATSLADPAAAVTAGLTNPLDFDLLAHIRSIATPPTVAIAINDKTRPVPHNVLIPPLLDWLINAGIIPDAITFIIASGTHTPMGENDFPLILPAEIYQRYKVMAHDCDDTGNLVSLGSSSIGTPITVNRKFMKADIRIVVGDIEPHHFMGFSGGVKTGAIGLAGRQTISSNHALITNPNARTACYDENPMRQDVEEIGRRIGVDIAINAILNDHKEVVRVLVGNPLSVMRAGIPMVRQLSLVPVTGMYDLVIASAGGHPKDINFYQAQKGLTHAAMLTRTGGSVLLVAACPEGAGNWLYENWMRGKDSHQQVLDDFSESPFEIGMHKAYLTSRIAVNKRVVLVSDLTEETAKRLLLETIVSLQSGVDALIANLRPESRIAILPQAVMTIPDLSTVR